MNVASSCYGMKCFECYKFYKCLNLVMSTWFMNIKYENPILKASWKFSATKCSCYIAMFPMSVALCYTVISYACK